MFGKTPVLKRENVVIGQKSVTRDEAIKFAGQLLIDSGYVSGDYVDAMYRREEIVSTFIGNGVAIPHGVGDAKGLIKKSGLVVVQYPNGIDYNGNTCYLVIGISGKDNDHIKILSNIAIQIGDIENAKELWKTEDADAIYNTFIFGDK